MALIAESPKEFQLPKSVMKWAAIGLVVTTTVVVGISIFSGVTFSDLTELGYLTFGLAALASASRLFVQTTKVQSDNARSN